MICPHCDAAVEPTEIGRCPKCRAMLPPAPQRPSNNPYEPPTLTKQELPKGVIRISRAWAYAIASILAPMTGIAIACGDPSLFARGGPTSTQLDFRSALDIIALMLAMAGLPLGILGFVSGWLCQQRNLWPVFLMSAMGVLIGTVALICSGILSPPD